MRRTTFCFIVLYCALTQNYVRSDLSEKAISKGAGDIPNNPQLRANKGEDTSPGVETPSVETATGKSNKAVKEEVNPNPRSGLSHTELSNRKREVQKGNILFFHNAGTRSHLIAMTALAEGLLENGHNVTSLYYAKSNIIHENYKEILIEDK